MFVSLQREIFNNFIVDIRDSLQSQGIIDRIEYAGSRYKGTAIDSSDYDNMFIKRDNNIIVSQSAYPNYFYLTTQHGYKINRSHRLSTFKDEIQLAINQIGASWYANITNAYGPTVVIDYDKPGERSFSVDMVYGLEVDGCIFVAKPYYHAGTDETNLWYKTVVLTEKRRMRTIDAKNGTGKMAIRLLKKLKEKEPMLQAINSYAFEQALMYLKDQYDDELFWRENNMMEILSVTLVYMQEALSRGVLPAYYEIHNNTIGNLTRTQRLQLEYKFGFWAEHPEIVLGKTKPGYRQEEEEDEDTESNSYCSIL
ncbi:hypothetical protein LSH36_287g02006 [Paralvinella palmiformis]|uniref:Mab-21-like HhH/H2TH-like domain-containing protein n=1 Tax=Paralvinella palmiformis TaxID=53620 RepID=A0AAD9JIE5_9ANNE|nr:hypothetical protein LSH36_287g02006 [Paralvinella palmiformis]